MAPARNPWDAKSWDTAAQASYIRTYGMARAEARARDAGTTVHGPKPKVVIAPRVASVPALKVIPMDPVEANGGVNPWSGIGWNMTLQAAYVREHGLAAAQAMAVQAGTTLGGKRPDMTPAVFRPRTYIINKVRVIGGGAGGGLVSFQAKFGIGYAELTAVTPEADLTVSQILGLAVDAASVQISKELVASAALGISDSTGVDVYADIRPAMALGVDMNPTPTVSGSISLEAQALLGIAEAVRVDRFAFLAAQVGLGVDEAASFADFLSLKASAGLGISEAAHVDRFAFLAALNTLGLTEVASLIREADLIAAAALGVSEAVAVSRTQFMAAAASLGITDTTTISRAINIAAHPTLGIAEAVATTVYADIVAAPALGVSEAAIAQAALAEEDITVSPALGVSQTAAITKFANLAATMGLGITDASTLTAILSIAAHPLLGVSEAAAPTTFRSIVAHPVLGVSEVVTAVTKIIGISASPALGISEAAAVYRQRNITAAPALGVTETPFITTIAPLSVTGATTVKSGTITGNFAFTGQSVGTASADRYLVVGAVGRSASANTTCSISLNGGAITPVASQSIGGTVSTTACQVGLALFAIPTGTTVEIDVSFASNSAGCCVGYWVVTGKSSVFQIAGSALNNSMSVGLATSNGGATFCVAGSRTLATNSFNFSSGVSFDFDIDQGTGSTNSTQLGGAHSVGNGGGTNTVTVSGGGAPSYCAMAIG